MGDIAVVQYGRRQDETSSHVCHEKKSRLAFFRTGPQQYHPCLVPFPFKLKHLISQALLNLKRKQTAADLFSSTHLVVSLSEIKFHFSSQFSFTLKRGVNRFSDRRIWPQKVHGLWICAVNRVDLWVLKTQQIVDRL